MTTINPQTFTTPAGALITPPFAKHLVTAFTPVPINRVRMVVSGMPKTGKSNFADGGDGNLILDFSNEARGIVALKSRPLDLTSMAIADNKTMFETVSSVISWLIEHGPAKTGYQRVTFDTGAKFYQAICEQLVKEYNEQRLAAKKPLARSIGEVGAEGAGYYAAATMTAGTLDALHKAGYGWTFIVHEKETKDDKGTVIGTELAIPPSLRTFLYQDAEFIVQVVREVVMRPKMGKQALTLPNGQTTVRDVVEGTETTLSVRLRITPTVANDPKGSRYPNMPSEIVLPLVGGMDAFGAAYAAANAASVKGGAPAPK